MRYQAKRKCNHRNGRPWRVLSVVMLGILLCTETSPTYASSLTDIQQQQQQVQQQIQDTQQDKDSAQNAVDNLQDEADSLNSTYQDLSKKLSTLSNEIDSTQSSIAAIQTEMEQLQEQKKAAEEAQKTQYEGMKRRIQYTYESGSSSLLVGILESGSVAEFVKRVEYTAEILSYDRNMLASYEELQNNITQMTADLEEKSQKLGIYQQTLTTKQDEMDDLVMNAGSAYSAKAGEVSVAQMTVDEYNAKIASYQQQEAQLEQKYAAAQAELAQQIAQEEAKEEQETGQTVVEDNSGAMSGYSQADLTLMAAIIQAEADNQSYEGKLAVGSVIMNRVKSSKFPNSLSGVIYQTNQFQPARDGHLDTILQRGPNATCINVAKEVLNGYRSGPWLFFMTQKWADYYGITGYTMIGAHAFFVKWGAN